MAVPRGHVKQQDMDSSTAVPYLETGKVDGRMELRTAGKKDLLAHGGFIAKVHLVKDEALGPFGSREADNGRHAVQRNDRAVDQVVHDDNVVVLLQQQHNRVTANVAAASSDQDSLSLFSFLLLLLLRHGSVISCNSVCSSSSIWTRCSSVVVHRTVVGGAHCVSADPLRRSWVAESLYGIFSPAEKKVINECGHDRVTNESRGQKPEGHMIRLRPM